MPRKRVFVQRHQVIAMISALGKVEGEQPGVLAALRLGKQTLLELVVDRVARCAGGITVFASEDGVDAAMRLVGGRARIVAAPSASLGVILDGLRGAEAPIVLLHDIAWPFATPQLMSKLALAALDHGAAVAAGPGEIAVGEVRDGFVLPPVGTPYLHAIAMPHALLREPLQQAGLEEDPATPAVQIWKLLQKRGEAVQRIANPGFNIRIATSLDWLTARKVIAPWLAARNRPAAGNSVPGPAPDGTPAS